MIKQLFQRKKTPGQGLLLRSSGTYNKKRKIQTEIKTVCHFQALKLSRYILAGCLSLLLIPLNLTPIYLIIALFLLPYLLNQVFRSIHPRQNTAVERQMLMKETLGRYHFTYSAYQAERITVILILLMLFLWQLPLRNLYFRNGLPLRQLPILLFALYYLCSTLLSFLLRFRMKRALTELDTL